MQRALKWLLVGIGLTILSVAGFIVAAALSPGDPGRSYLIFGLILLAITLAWRLLRLPMD